MRASKPRLFVLVLAILLPAGLVAVGLCFATWHVRPSATFGRFDHSTNPPLRENVRLKLITWNVWGIPLATPMRAERLRAIAREVAKSGADIACFQEVFLDADRREICRILAEAGLIHAIYFSSPPVGSGLLTVSRHPIRETAFHRYTRGGNPFAVQHGDWWAGKGAGVATIEITGIGAIRIINTHLHARYAGDHYREVRQSQLQELVSVVDKTAESGSPTFLLGDLNHHKNDEYWAGLLEREGWLNLTRMWSPIDYILAIPSERYSFRHTGGRRLAGVVPGTEITLSDHSGVLAEVRIVPAGNR